MLFTIEQLVRSCTSSDDINVQYEEFKDKLDQLTPLLTPVPVRVINGEIRSNSISQDAATEYNRTACTKLKMIREFVHRHLSRPQDFENNILHEHVEIISAVERELHVQKFNPHIIKLSTNRQTGRRYQSFNRFGTNCQVYFIMKMLQMFGESKYFNAENGLQDLLRLVSITNEVGNRFHELTGEEAFRQQVEMGHKHHLIGGDDINPINIKVEGQPENNASKRCSNDHTTECQCAIPCDPRLGPLYTSLERFNAKTLELMLMPCKCMGMGEVAIRTKLRDVWIALFERHSITQEDDRFPDFLKEDRRETLLTPLYLQYQALRGVHAFDAYTPGITITTAQGTRKLTYAEWQASLSDPDVASIPIPATLDTALREQIPILTPAPPVAVNSNLGELDRLRGKTVQDIEAYATKENDYTFKRTVCIHKFLKRDAPNLVYNHRGSTQEERDCGALHHRKNLDEQAQRCVYHFCRDDAVDPRPREIPNNTAFGNSGTSHMYQPTLPRLALHTSFVWDYYELFAANSDHPLQDITNFLSIRSLTRSQGGINSDLVHVQELHASHLLHLDLSDAEEVRQARDISTKNMTWDSPDDNRGRMICSLLPYLTCLRLCKCHTPCKPALFKLTEFCWYKICEIQYALGSNGRHPGERKNAIKLHYLGLFRQAYETIAQDDEDVVVPEWIPFWEDGLSTYPDKDNMRLTCKGVGCDDHVNGDGAGFLLYTDTKEHELHCPHVDDVAPPPPEEEEEVEQVEYISKVGSFTLNDVRRLCKAIILEGHGSTRSGNECWTPVLNRIKTLHREELQEGEVLRVPSSGKICGNVLTGGSSPPSRTFKSMCNLDNIVDSLGIADSLAYARLLKDCSGSINYCPCELHPTAEDEEE